MIKNYETFWKEIFENLNNLKKQVVVQGDEAKKINVSADLKSKKDHNFTPDTKIVKQPTSITVNDAYVTELKSLLSTFQKNVSELQSLCDKPIGNGDNYDVLNDLNNLKILMKTCSDQNEMIKHLMEITSTDNSIEIDIDKLLEKLNKYQNIGKEREQKLKDLRDSARVKCPLCMKSDWKTIEMEFWRLEQWLDNTVYVQNIQTAIPSNFDQFERLIHDERSFLLDLDGYRSLLVSLNTLGVHLIEHTDFNDLVKIEFLRKKLQIVNTNWQTISKKANQWNRDLKKALKQNSNFRQKLHELNDVLVNSQNIIEKNEPIIINDELHVQFVKYRELTSVRKQLMEFEPKALKFREIVCDLFRDSESNYENEIDLNHDLEFYQQVSSIYIRLISMNNLLKSYISQLEGFLRDNQHKNVDQEVCLLFCNIIIIPKKYY